MHSSFFFHNALVKLIMLLLLPASGNANATSGLKIAYVEVDTLLSQYNFCKDLNADMISKEENSRMVLNQKANELRKSQQGIPEEI